MEARVFGDDVAELWHEAGDPVYSIYFGVFTYSLDSHFSDCWNSIFEEIENQRFQVFWEKVIVLSMY